MQQATTGVQVTELANDQALAPWVVLANEIRPCQVTTVEEMLHWISQSPGERYSVAAVDGIQVGVAAYEPLTFLADQTVTWGNLLIASPETLERVHGSGPNVSREQLDQAAEALVQYLFNCARTNGKQTLRVGLYEEEVHLIELWNRHGLQIIERHPMVARDLADAPASISGSSELELRVLQPDSPIEYWQGAYEVVKQAWADIPSVDDFVAPPFEEWFELVARNPGSSRWGTLMLWSADGKPAAYASLIPSRGEPGVIGHGLTAVERSWRGKGAAKQIKIACFAWARQHGYTRIKTDNHEDNAPMRHINKLLGYEPIPGKATMSGPVPQATT